ncbi:hypothetical protein WB926_005460, partial [Salmonella enterica]
MTILTAVPAFVPGDEDASLSSSLSSPDLEDSLARKALETQVTQLVKDSESLRTDVTALTTQKDSLKHLTDALSSRLDEQIFRIDSLSVWKVQREKKA